MRTIRSAAVILFVFLATASPAVGQERCPRCIEPSDARVDSKLRVGHPTERAIWNPPPRLLSPRQAHFHVDGSPSVVAYDGIRQPGFVFRAPDVEPGRYLVALFDNSEGNTGYTWDLVKLEAGLPEEAPTDGMPEWAVALAIGAGVLLAGAAAAARIYRGRSS
jgi:hypothetical protein